MATTGLHRAVVCTCASGRIMAKPFAACLIRSHRSPYGRKPAQARSRGHIDIDGFNAPPGTVGLMPKAAIGRVCKEALPPAGMRSLTRESLQGLLIPPVLANAHMVPLEQELLVTQQSIRRILSQSGKPPTNAQKRRQSPETTKLQSQKNDHKVRIGCQVHGLPRYRRLHPHSPEAYNVNMPAVVYIVNR